MLRKNIYNRQKKKKISRLLLCGFCAVVLLGCDSKTVETQNNNIVDTTEESTTQNFNGEEFTVEEIREEETVVLTEQELAQWTEYVNSRENNAFLLSYYNEPKQIDLNELFYTGCGLDLEELSEEEVQAYLEGTGMDEIHTDVTRITGEQIETVLKQRLGLTMEDMEQSLEWCYLADSNAYVMQHGDTNAQNFTCIAGSRTGNQVVLDCFSHMTDFTCRVTLELPENSEIWMFVSNVAVDNVQEEGVNEAVDNEQEQPEQEEGVDEVVDDEQEQPEQEEEDEVEDSIFISDEAYMEVSARLGQENALQLSVFAENYERWLPEEGETAGGTLGLAVHDLDKDGQLELMCALVQGTGLYACNTFYQADVENGKVFELKQKESPTELAFEIAYPLLSEEWVTAYEDEQGRILHISADYGRAGMQSASCTEGYYYLENQEVVSVPIRSYVVEYNVIEDNEDGEEIYTYYLADSDTPVTKEEWEKAPWDFQIGKKALEESIGWKSLYETEIAEKKVPDWFLLLAESLEGEVG